MKWLLFLIALLAVAPAAARTGTAYIAPTGSVSIPVSSQSGPFPQSISANNWTGFASQAGSVFQTNNWTSPVATFSYLQGNDYHQLVAQTTATPLDVEVTTWTRSGTVYARISNGTAIYFNHNGETLNGTIQIGVVTNLLSNSVYDATNAKTGAYRALYTNANMNGTVAGYNNASTNSAVFKFGVRGLDVYAQFSADGGSTWTEFVRLKQTFVVAPGAVAFAADSGYGFRNVAVSYLAAPLLASTPSVARFNPLDWGLKSGQTTGSITAGSNTLTLASSLNVAVGDSIIIAVGGESGGGLRGTVGVGGTNPNLSFANATARDADTTESDGTFSWTTNDGNAYQWSASSGTWVVNGFYYGQKVAPRALLATVTAVSNGGTTLALDTNASFTGSISGRTLTVSNVTGTIKYGQQVSGAGVASNTFVTGGGGTTWTVSISQSVSSEAMTSAGVIASTTNAGVYVNGYAPISAVLNPNGALPALSYQTVDLPAGTYAIGTPLNQGVPFAPMSINQKTGWRILGQGSGASGTKIISPFGAESAGFVASQSPSTEIGQLAIVGNNASDKFGAVWTSDNFYTPSGQRGIEFDTNSDNSIAHDWATTDTFYSGLSVSFGINVTAYNFSITQNFQPATGSLEPFYIEYSDSQGGGAWDGTVTLSLMNAGLEIFRGAGGEQFKRITLNNATFACNSCGGGFLLEDLVFNVGVNIAGNWLPTGPIIDINNNEINANFNGTISGTTLTVNSVTSGAVAVGQYLSGLGLLANTTIVSGSGTSWVVNNSQNVGPITIHSLNPALALGGTVRRPTVIQQGLYDNTNILLAISVNVDNPNIVIEGSYSPTAYGKGCLQAPDWQSSMTNNGAQGIINDGTNLIVRNMRIIGRPGGSFNGRNNIYNQLGSITATSNIMDTSVSGSGTPLVESGTESNATWNAANPGHTGC